MKAIQEIIAQAKTAREKVTDHLKGTFKRGGLYGILTVAFYFSIQDSGFLFWIPLLLMILTSISCVFKLIWGTVVLLILFRVDGVVEEAQGYHDIAQGVVGIAREHMTRNEAAIAERSTVKETDA